MQILVCVKQVPDRESAFRISPTGTALEEEGLLFSMNEYDEQALEEAVRIKETTPDETSVTALTIGPPRAEQVLRRALECGADLGVHIHTPADVVLDGLQKSSLIAAYARRHHFDLLLFGIMSEDLQRAQAGPMTAALLDLPLATSVIAERLSEDRNRVTVERELEAGRREVLELPLPCVLTVQTGINLPRYPSLTNKLRARKQQIEVLSLADFPTAPACQGPSRLLVPPTPAGGVVLEGPLADQAEALVRVFYEKSLLR